MTTKPIRHLAKSVSGVLLFFSTTIASAAGPTAITGFSPFYAPAGTVLNVAGISLTGTTNVYFEPSNTVSAASSSVVNDSLLHVTVPPLDPNGPTRQALLVVNGNVGTLAMPDDAISVTSTQAFAGGDNCYVVQSGATLTGGGASALIYVKNGGRYTDTGGGEQSVVLETGATLDGISGGDMHIFTAPGSHNMLAPFPTNLLFPLSGVSLSTVRDLFTYEPLVPEPSTCVMVSIAAAAISSVRRRSKSLPARDYPS
jgi:hypothetical protein